MNFQKFKIDSYCVGGRHRSATTKLFGDKTGEGIKILIGYCSICNRKKSMTVSDNTILAEVLRLTSLGIWVKKDLLYQKRWQKTY